MATNPNYSTAPTGQYPLADPYTLDPVTGDEQVLDQQQYDTSGVNGQTGPIPDPSGQYPASNAATLRDGSGGAFGEPADIILTAAQSSQGATPPLVPAIQLETTAYGVGTQADGLLVNPSANGGGGGNDYLATGNLPGQAYSYVAPTYAMGAISGTTDTQSGGGSPIQQANPAYRAPEAYPAAVVLDTTRTDQPVSANNTDPYGISANNWISQSIDWTYPTYPLQTTTTNTTTAPATPTAVAINRGAAVTIQTEADPSGAAVRGYRVESVHLKSGYATSPGTSWTGDAIAAAGVTFFNKIPTSKTYLTAPAAPVPTKADTGGTVAAGTYQVVVTYVNAVGETVGSVAGAVTTTTATSTITVPSPAAQTGATGWYAYVTQAGGAANTATRQQTAGSPTAIGTNLTLTAPPTNTGALAPSTNTAVTGNFVTANVDDLVPGDFYAFRVMAINDNGTSAPSAWSNVVSPLLYDEVPLGSLDPANAINPIYLPDGTIKANTGGTVGPVNPDTGSFIAEPVTGQPTQLNLTWSAPAWGTPTGFTIKIYRVAADFPVAGVGSVQSQELRKTQTVSTGTPSFPVNVTGLTEGHQYIVEVIPFNASGNGIATFSEIVTAGGAVEPEPLTNEVTIQ